MVVPNNLNIHSYRSFSRYGITIAFFAIQLSKLVLEKTLLLLDCIVNLCYEEIVWRQLGLAFFGAVTPVVAPFLLLIGGNMDNNIPKRVIDITGIELTPGEPSVCLGNGDQGFECCCDECDYFLLCFPEFDIKIEDKINDIELPPLSRRHKIRMNRLFRERVGGTFLPFPEADNFYERVRSKVVIKLKINEFFDRCKERRRIR